MSDRATKAEASGTGRRPSRRRGNNPVETRSAHSQPLRLEPVPPRLPLALGTMTFGAERWGSGEKASRAVFDAYVEAGGNFVDTADVYSAGRSEEMLGSFIAEAGLRDRLVVATKAGFPRAQGNPHAGGNGAKNIRLGLEGSLERLRTDYIDMCWIHVWDRITPAEEALQTLADAVRAGNILHYGFSNTPGWYVAKIATLAKAHDLPAPIGLQYQYSLIDRGVELDILPAGNEFGLVGYGPSASLVAGPMTELDKDAVGEDQVPSNRGRKQHSNERGQDRNAIKTEQRQDHSASRRL